ncbi:MAG: hypothetical protein HY077_06380 [Elusimicrobia bacterium]|nr:hypothetical protein [Elusimicrobiota bacterium]
MKAILAMMSLGLACVSWAADRPGPRCPDSSRPHFSGHPFAPFLCPGAPNPPLPGPGEGLVTAATAPTKDPAKTSFEPLMGRWDGWAVYGISRFEVLASVEKGRHGILVKFAAMDYITHAKNKFTAELKTSFWHSDRYNAVVTEVDLPESPLDGRAWLGGAAPPVAQGLDRAFVLAYDHLAALHEVRFVLDGADKIRYSYLYRLPGQPAVQMGGTLTRSTREPF